MDKHDLSSVRFFFSGAAPLAPDPARRLVARVGIPIIQGYGLTETSPVTHANPFEAAVIESIGPDDTADVIRDGWFHTGDVGRKDERGYVFIVDRKKEFIRYKGFGVGPAEVEAVLCEHPAVADAGVIGKPDLEAGEIPKAFVQLRPDATVTATELMDFVKTRLADYKRVREIEFVDKVPRTASGKILRRELAARERA